MSEAHPHPYQNLEPLANPEVLCTPRAVIELQELLGETSVSLSSPDGRRSDAETLEVDPAKLEALSVIETDRSGLHGDQHRELAGKIVWKTLDQNFENSPDAPLYRVSTFANAPVRTPLAAWHRRQIRKGHAAIEASSMAQRKTEEKRDQSYARFLDDVDNVEPNSVKFMKKEYDRNTKADDHIATLRAEQIRRALEKIRKHEERLRNRAVRGKR